MYRSYDIRNLMNAHVLINLLTGCSSYFNILDRIQWVTTNIY